MTSHTDPIDGVDLEALARLRATAGRLDPTPPGLADRVKFALTVHAMHAELAELTESTLVGIRADSAPADTDSVTFAAGSLSLMVTWRGDDGRQRLRIDGWVTFGGAHVSVVSTTETFEVECDAFGRFVVTGVPYGPVHFVVQKSAEERAVLTPVITLPR